MDEQELLILEDMLSNKATLCANETIKHFTGLTVLEAHMILDYLKLKVMQTSKII